MSSLEKAGTSATGRILVRVTVALMIGTLVYLITNPIAASAIISGLILSVFISGAVLVIQFLIEFERRLGRVEFEFGRRLAGVEEAQQRHSAKMQQLVEVEFSKINEATQLFGLVEASALRTDVVTQLVRHSTQIDPMAPPLIFRFAQAEIGRMSEFLKELSEGGDVMYPGEDRDWMLGLARTAASSIDATSLTTVDARGKGFVDGGLWASDLGQRYLEVQREAVGRGVQIRRVFILERRDLAHDPDFRQACELQREMGIEVRVLDPSTVPNVQRSSLFDFVLFDEAISYEVTPATRIADSIPTSIVNTRLELRPLRVEDRIQRFKDLWASARDIGGAQDPVNT